MRIKDRIRTEPTPAWGTDEERDRRHEEVVRRFPGGLSWEQFVFCTLESARDDTDLVELPSVVAGSFAPLEFGNRMFFDGLLTHREGYNAPIRWRITAKGRARLAELKAAHPEYSVTSSAE